MAALEKGDRHDAHGLPRARRLGGPARLALVRRRRRQPRHVAGRFRERSYPSGGSTATSSTRLPCAIPAPGLLPGILVGDLDRHRVTWFRDVRHLAAAASPAVVRAAALDIEQWQVTGNPYPSLGSVVVDHVNLGPHVRHARLRRRGAARRLHDPHEQRRPHRRHRHRRALAGRRRPDRGPDPVELPAPVQLPGRPSRERHHRLRATSTTPRTAAGAVWCRSSRSSTRRRARGWSGSAGDWTSGSDRFHPLRRAGSATRPAIRRRSSPRRGRRACRCALARGSAADRGAGGRSRVLARG